MYCSDAAKELLYELNAAGHSAYLVGGCVRDSLMGRTPHDEDITTSALPEEVEALFSGNYRVIETGLKHGTVTVLVSGVPYEITTMRTEGGYRDNRHPDRVAFVREIRQDLARRDFTVNAMAWSPAGGLVDPFGGQEDLERKVIRAVGKAEDRFREDALRMLRAVRFSARLGFEIEAETRNAIRNNSPLLRSVSKERIRDELCGILVSDHPEQVAELYHTGLLQQISPALAAMFETPQNNPWHRGTVGEHTLWAMQNVPPVTELRLAMLLHDAGKVRTRTTDGKGIDHFYGHPAVSGEIAGAFLREYRFSNRELGRILPLVRSHDELSETAAGKALRRHVRNFLIRHREQPDQFFRDFLAVKRADCLAQNTGYERAAAYRPVLEQLERIIPEYLADERGEHLPRVLSDLAISGSDLKTIARGKDVGKLLVRLLRVVIDDPSENDRETLLALAPGEYRAMKREGRKEHSAESLQN